MAQRLLATEEGATQTNDKTFRSWSSELRRILLSAADMLEANRGDFIAAGLPMLEHPHYGQFFFKQN